MIGAIIGDCVGSRFEWNNFKSKRFELITEKSKFTDDTVLTIAIADAIINNRKPVEALVDWSKRNLTAGYGGTYRKWIYEPDHLPYNSWGNGSAMRTSSVGWLFNTLEEVLDKSKFYAEVTHNHPEGIKGAQSVSTAIFLARNKATKSDIKSYIESQFGYNLDRTLAEIRPEYKFDVSCQGSVPESIIAFLESKDYVDAIKFAVSLGGDSDTIGCICGGIAEAFYGTDSIPRDLITDVKALLKPDMLYILEQFDSIKK